MYLGSAHGRHQRALARYLSHDLLYVPRIIQVSVHTKATRVCRGDQSNTSRVESVEITVFVTSSITLRMRTFHATSVCESYTPI